MTIMPHDLKARLWDSQPVPLNIIAGVLHHCLVYDIREDRDNSHHILSGQYCWDSVGQKMVHVEEEINCNISEVKAEMMGRIRVPLHLFNLGPSETNENTVDKQLLTEDKIKETIPDGHVSKSYNASILERIWTYQLSQGLKHPHIYCWCAQYTTVFHDNFLMPWWRRKLMRNYWIWNKSRSENRSALREKKGVVIYSKDEKRNKWNKEGRISYKKWYYRSTKGAGLKNKEKVRECIERGFKASWWFKTTLLEMIRKICGGRSR